MIKMLKALAAVVGGVAGAFVLVSAVGMFRLRAIGLRAGAEFDLQNTLVGIVQPPVIPYLQYLAVAALATLAVFLFIVWPARFRPLNRWLLKLTFLITLAVLVWFGIDLEHQFGPGIPPDLELPSGLEGWVLFGGPSSALHVVLLIGLASLIPVRRKRSPERARSDSSPEPELID